MNITTADPTCSVCGCTFRGRKYAKYCPACRPEAYRELGRRRYREEREKRLARAQKPRTRADQARLQRAYALVREGMKKSEFAAAAGVRAKDADHLLSVMENNNYLLWEDNGRIGRIF